MADRVFKVELTGDAIGFTKAFSGASKTADSLTKSLKLTAAQMDGVHAEASRMNDSFGASAAKVGAFSGSMGAAAKTLARSADAFGLPVGALRTLDDTMDVAELGFKNLTTSTAGFNAASIGVAGAGLAIGVAIGGMLNQFEGVRTTMDSATQGVYDFLAAHKLFGESTRDQGAGMEESIGAFSAAMAAKSAEAISKQVTQLKAQGVALGEIAKMYEGRLSPALAVSLGLTDKQVESSKKAASAAKKAGEERTRQAEAEAKAARDLVDSLSGATAEAELGKLAAAWDKLTPEQKKNEQVVKRLIEKYKGLRDQVGAGKLPSELEAIYAVLQRLDLGDLSQSLDESTAAWQEWNQEIADSADELKWLQPLILKNKTQLIDQKEAAEDAADAQAEMASGWQDLGSALGGLGSTISELGGGTAEVFGTAVQVGGTLAGVFGNINDASIQSRSNVSKLSGVVGALGSILGQTGNKWQGLIQGAMSGASAGSSFGGWGALIGALGGAAAGYGMGAKGENDANIAGARQTWKDLTQYIDDNPMFKGDEFDPLNKQLDDYKAKTKKAAEDTGTWWQAALGIGKGAGGFKGMALLGATGGSYKGGGPGMLMQRMGVLGEKDTANQMGGTDVNWEAMFAQADKWGLHLREAYAEGGAALNDSLAQYMALAEEAKKVDEEIAASLQSAIPGVAAMIAGIDITSAADAQAQGAIFAATFFANLKTGGIAAVKEMAPAWQELQKKLSESGFSAGGTLAGVGSIMSMLSNEKLAPILSGVDGLAQAFKGIGDAGYMTTQTFSAFQQQASSAFDKLVAGGASSSAALQALAPTLGMIVSSADKYGLTLDANTQKLVDQAKAAGVSFPTDPMDRMVTVLEAIATVLGADVPAAAADAGSALETELGGSADTAGTALETELGTAAVNAGATLESAMAGAGDGISGSMGSATDSMSGDLLGLSLDSGFVATDMTTSFDGEEIFGSAGSALTSLSDQLTGDIPDDADVAVNGIKKAFDGLTIEIPVSFKKQNDPSDTGDGSDDSSTTTTSKTKVSHRKRELPSFADGGIGNFGSGTLAMLHGIEAITPLDRLGNPTSGGQVQNNYEFHNNPLQTAESTRQMNEHFVRLMRTESGRSLAGLVADGNA